MASLKQLEPEILLLEHRQHAFAPLFRAMYDRLEASEAREGLTADALQRLAYEAAAGARTEVRKLVEIEVRRQWARIAPWLLVSLALGASLGWLAHGGF